MRRLVGVVFVLGCGRTGFDTIDASTGGVVDAALATTITFGETPTADVQGVTSDTTVSNETGASGNNYGGSSKIECETGGGQKHGLVRFDLAVLGANSQILSAELHLTSTTGTGSMTVRPVLEAWSEGTANGTAGIANYTQRTASATWTTPGVDAPGSAGAVLATIGVTAGLNVIVVPPAAVQSWVDSQNSNAGFVLTCSGDVQIVSREGTPATDRPVLIVTRQ